MSVDYAIMERARGAAAESPIMALAKRRFAPFMETLGGCPAIHLSEGSPLKFNDYRGGLAKALKMHQ